MSRVYKRIPPPPGAKILGWDPKNEAGLAVVPDTPTGRYASPYDDVDALNGGRPLDWTSVPEGLTGEGVARWESLAREFAAVPTRFREGDRGILTRLCRWYALYAQAEAAIEEDGLTVGGRSESDRNRVVKHPAWQQLREAEDRILRLERQLGLAGQSSRDRMANPLPERPDDNENPFQSRESH
jgi:P27 family predicted phage terminase small subunit